MAKKTKYILSFNAASLRLNETVKVAKAAMDNNTGFDEVRESGAVFSSIKSKSSIRQFHEIRKRIEQLTPNQRNILVSNDLIAQKQIAYLAICKRYDFIRDFVIEVIRDKALVYDFKINESDFNSFVTNKVQIHPELEKFSESTIAKAKQVVFLILEQSGIINNIKEKMIQPQILQPDVIKVIVEDNPAWMKIFMMPDKDIEKLKI